MGESRDTRSDSRRRSPRDSPDRNRDRRPRDSRNDHHGSSRRRDDTAQPSHRGSSRRRNSHSPSDKSRSRRHDDSHRRERRERSISADHEDRQRHRHRSHRHREERGRDSGRSSRRSRSPRRRSRSPRRPSSPSKEVQRRGPLPSQTDAFSNELTQSGDGPPPPEKEKPNFKNTGRLATESNTIQTEGGEGIVLKYHEPPEARKPPSKEPWRLYVFKGDDMLEMVELGERSCWLVGRERAVADFPLDHPSCSKQHAALQFRYVEKRNEYGDRIGKVKPYIIDLESANGTSVNGDPVPGGRYVEVMDKDVIKFGLSSREYVMMLPS